MSFMAEFFILIYWRSVGMTKKKICSKKAKNKMQLYHSGSMKKSCLSFALSISFESFVFEMRYLESKGFDRYSTVLATVQ